MAIPLWGVSRKHRAVVGPRAIVGPDLEAPDGRQSAFPLAFRRHSSAGRRREVFRTFTKLIPKPHLFAFEQGAKP